MTSGSGGRPAIPRITSRWGDARTGEETDAEVIIPRGAIGKLLRFCRENKVDYEFQDERQKLTSIIFVCDVNLRDHQKLAIEASGKKDFGVIVAPPGTGKTIIALKIIEAMGFTGDPFQYLDRSVKRAGQDVRYAIDDSKAQKELGYQRTYKNFEEGIKVIAVSIQ